MQIIRQSLALCLLVLSHHLATAQSVDQLLSRYANVSHSQRYALAKQLCDSFLTEDVYFTPPQNVRPDMPADTLDALVYYGAVCHYFCTEKRKQLQEYARLALPLLNHHHPLYYNSVLSNSARAYYYTGQVKKALDVAQQAERKCQEIKDYRELSRVYTTLSLISTTEKQGQDAVDYVLKAIDANRLSGDTLLIHVLFGAACEAYCTLGDYRRSIDYGWQGVRAASHRGSSPDVLSTHFARLGYTYYLADSLEASKRVLLEAVRLENEGGVYSDKEITYQHLGLLYMKENNKAEAAKWFRKALEQAKIKGNPKDVCNLTRNLSDALSDSDPKESLRLLRQSYVLRDSIYNQELQAKLSETSASFHNDQLRQENEHTRHINRIILLSLIVGMLLAAAAITLLVYSVRTRKKVIIALQKLQVTRDTFFTNITHELRTPLTVIIGISQQLGSKLGGHRQSTPESDSKAAHDLTLIEHNGQRLLTLVNQLLDIAKASSDMGSIKWQRGDVAAFVSMVVEAARPLADSNGVALTNHPQSGMVVTDFVADYIQKITSNLIYNALKFTPSGGEVSVTTRADNKLFTIEVSDTGCGIPSDDLPHIFEPFFQGSNHTTAGTGVGLALVHQLTEALGGKVDVTSTVGQGALFKVRMPLRHQEGTEAVTQLTIAKPDMPFKEEMPLPGDMPTEEPGDMTTEKTGATRILVVEDNHDVAYYIGNVLGDHYDVAYASDGRQGLEMARQQMPDLIVTDIMMPDMDGLEMCRQIRADELTNHIPIVIITARATDDDRLTGIGAGADAYLYKPFRSDELLLRVEKLLEQRQMLQRKFSKMLGIVPETATDEAVDEVSKPETDIAPAEADVAPAESIFERNVRQANEEFIKRFEAIVLRLLSEGDLSTDRVASELCMSRSQLLRKTRAVIDMTPGAYILDIRLREAKRLLKVTPPLTLLDIAVRCGFSDHAHLTNTFKRKYGITPSQYIKSEVS